MGFRDVKTEALKRLKEGFIQHETDRAGDINVKNLLLTGEMSVEEVMGLINKTRGNQYESSPHHAAPEIEVHTFKPDGWYVKFYFLEPDIVFISVHR